jgi:hypothetical protein
MHIRMICKWVNVMVAVFLAQFLQCRMTHAQNYHVAKGNASQRATVAGQLPELAEPARVGGSAVGFCA